MRGKRCPRQGTRVRFEANPASAALYSGSTPHPGEVGTVTTVSLPGAGRKTCTGAHQQDLVYVQWPSIGTMGVARADVVKAKGRGGFGAGDSLRKPASWVIREKATGQVVFETFNEEVVRKLNTKKYEAIPILQYLQELNRKGGGGSVSGLGAMYWVWATGRPPVPHSDLTAAKQNADHWQGRVEKDGKVVYENSLARFTKNRGTEPAVNFDGLGDTSAPHMHLSIGQRVITPHGEGEVRSKLKTQVGVQLDDGSYVAVAPHEIQRTAIRQRYFEGLGLPQEQHSRRANNASGQAVLHIKQATQDIRRGDCREGLANMMQSAQAVALAEENSLAAGAQFSDTLRTGLESVYENFRVKCVRGGGK